MGMYDTVIISDDASVQVKSGSCMLNEYQKGDNVAGEFAEGIHIGYGGWFVVDEDIIVAVGTINIFDKWGGNIALDIYDVVDGNNSLNDMVEDLTKGLDIEDEVESN